MILTIALGIVLGGVFLFYILPILISLVFLLIAGIITVLAWIWEKLTK